jgi:hypothetical protein
MEQIECGKRFIDEFDKHVPIRAAFWLKASEDSGWYLHVASDQFIDTNIRKYYGQVGKLAKAIDDPNFDQFRVKLIGMSSPFAREAVAHYKRFRTRIPTRIPAGQFGGVGVEGVYLYPPPAAAVAK